MIKFLSVSFVFNLFSDLFSFGKIASDQKINSGTCPLKLHFEDIEYSAFSNKTQGPGCCDAKIWRLFLVVMLEAFQRKLAQANALGGGQ